MGSILISALLLVWANAGAQATAQENFCRVDNGTAPYSGKIVRIRGKITKYYGALYLHTEGCTQPLILAYPDGVKPKPAFQLQKNKEYKRFERATRDFRKGSLELRSDILATFEGRLDWAFERDSSGKFVHGTRGFGHLGTEAWSLVIKSVSEVEIRHRE